MVRQPETPLGGGGEGPGRQGAVSQMGTGEAAGAAGRGRDNHLSEEHRQSDRETQGERGTQGGYTAPQGRQVAPEGRLRRLRELVVDRPGSLVQMDSKHVAAGNGKVLYQFGAVDCFTRKRVVALAPRLTSHHGAEFLKRVVAQFPFPVQAVQSDGGSEFLKSLVLLLHNSG